MQRDVICFMYFRYAYRIKGKLTEFDTYAKLNFLIRTIYKYLTFTQYKVTSSSFNQIWIQSQVPNKFLNDFTSIFDFNTNKIMLHCRIRSMAGGKRSACLMIRGPITCVKSYLNLKRKLFNIQVICMDVKSSIVS